MVQRLVSYNMVEANEVIWVLKELFSSTWVTKCVLIVNRHIYDRMFEKLLVNGNATNVSVQLQIYLFSLLSGFLLLSHLSFVLYLERTCFSPSSSTSLLTLHFSLHFHLSL